MKLRTHVPHFVELWIRDFESLLLVRHALAAACIFCADALCRVQAVISDFAAGGLRTSHHIPVRVAAPVETIPEIPELKRARLSK